MIAVIPIQSVGCAEPDKTAPILKDLKYILVGNPIGARKMLKPDSRWNTATNRSGAWFAA
jgi:hypothetical protein